MLFPRDPVIPHLEIESIQNREWIYPRVFILSLLSPRLSQTWWDAPCGLCLVKSSDWLRRSGSAEQAVPPSSPFLTHFHFPTHLPTVVFSSHPISLVCSACRRVIHLLSYDRAFFFVHNTPCTTSQGLMICVYPPSASFGIYVSIVWISSLLRGLWERVKMLFKNIKNKWIACVPHQCGYH